MTQFEEQPADANEQSLRIEELKLLIDAGRDYFGFYLKAFVLFFAALGIVLKIFFDAEGGSDARLVAFLAGLVINAGAVAGNLVARPSYRAIARRFAVVADSLGIPDVYFAGLLRTSLVFQVGLITIGLGWLLLIRHL